MDYVAWVERVLMALGQAYQALDDGLHSYGAQREDVAVATGVIASRDHLLELEYRPAADAIFAAFSDLERLGAVQKSNDQWFRLKLTTRGRQLLHNGLATTWPALLAQFLDEDALRFLTKLVELSSDSHESFAGLRQVPINEVCQALGLTWSGSQCATGDRLARALEESELVLYDGPIGAFWVQPTYAGCVRAMRQVETTLPASGRVPPEEKLAHALSEGVANSDQQGYIQTGAGTQWNVDEARADRDVYIGSPVTIYNYGATAPATVTPSPAPPGPRTQVFISYSHVDQRWLKRLQTHLRPLVRQGTIDLWDDTQIAPGTDWRAAIAQALARARVAVLLVTPDFLASDFVATEELPKLLDAAGRAGLTILWVAVRPSAYKQSPIARYQAANDPARPLSRLSAPRIDEALVQISNTIAQAAQVPLALPAPPPEPAPPTVPVELSATPFPDHLTGPQARQLVGALVSAFPDRSALAKMLDYGLALNIDTIAGSGSVENTAFEVMRWALAQGRLAELLQAAQDDNPGNPKLRAFLAQFEGRQ